MQEGAEANELNFGAALSVVIPYALYVKDLKNFKFPFSKNAPVLDNSVIDFSSSLSISCNLTVQRLHN